MAISNQEVQQVRDKLLAEKEELNKRVSAIHLHAKDPLEADSAEQAAQIGNLAVVSALENEAVIDMSQMFGFIRRQVALAADQMPEYGDIRRAGHEGGDFLFVRVR